MSVRKRTWKTRKGEAREAFIVDYFDQDGERHIRTFEREKDAKDYAAKVRIDVKHHGCRGGGQMDQGCRGGWPRTVNR